MCLIFISLQQHPRYSLIVAANRDEFYKRKTEPAAFWPEQRDLLGGRDLEAGGTWLGMTKSGRVAMLTNYRDPKNIRANAPSRGHLVSDYLASSQTPQTFLSDLESRASSYNGFNLLVGNIAELWYFSNYRKGITRLEPGFYGISNELLETPWPKVKRGKTLIAPAMNKTRVEADELFAIMYDAERAEDAKLPDTGIGIERERALSSMFIKTDNYGSRSSTVLIAERSGHVEFRERAYDTKTFAYSTQTFEFEVAHHPRQV